MSGARVRDIYGWLTGSSAERNIARRGYRDCRSQFADELARRNARSINQALNYVAGVSANQRGGMVTRYDQMYLRGFSPAFYLDGMRLIAGPYSTPQVDSTASIILMWSSESAGRRAGRPRRSDAGI